MKNIETHIIIESNLEEAWNTLMDHNSYPEWNPFIKQIKGNTKEGDILDVVLQLKDKKPMAMAPKVLVNNNTNEFRWKGKLFVEGLFDGEHYFKLEAIDNHKVKFIHGENFTGILAGPILKIIQTDTKNGFEAMNQAFKKLIEQKQLTLI